MKKTDQYLSDALVIINIERRYSRKNSEYYYIIEGVSGWDPVIYRKTYISEENENFSEWRKVITAWTGTEAIAVRGDFRIRKSDPSLINADCLVEVLGKSDLQAFLEEVRASFD